MTKTLVMCLISLLLSVPDIALAQADVKGGKDHPLVGRFAGSVIRIYEEKGFDEYTLPLGKQIFRDKQYRWTRSERLEGKVTRITYVARKDASTLAILRSYEDALKKAGFELLFAGGKGDFLDYGRLYEEMNPYPEYRRQYLLGSESPRYLAARLPRPEGDVYVAVYAAIGSVSATNNPTIQLDVVEVKALEGGLVTAETMATELGKAGRIAIYSIYFDTGKAEVKPESEATLAEIGKLLRGNTGLSLYVVGHTDNVGTLPYNMDLSQRRAEAVVRTVVEKHGIDPQHLRSAGVGPLAPVAPNTREEGRAKNRRVELVAQ